MPGKGVLVLRTMPERATMARPIHAMIAAGRTGIRARWAAPMARKAPRPSSQARVGREKNAHGWLAPVSHSDRPNETTAMVPAAIPMRRPTSPPRRASSRTIAGQKT